MGRVERGARGFTFDASSIEFLTPRTAAFGHGAITDGAEPPFDGGDPAFSDVDDDGPRSRWITVGAGVGLLALVSVGVIAAAPWHDDAPAATAPTTTMATSTTVAAAAAAAKAATAAKPAASVGASATDEALDENAPTGGYLLDPILLANDWRVVGGLSPMTSNAQRATAEAAASADDDGRTLTDTNGWLELWATPAAARDRGSWFAVQYTPRAEPFARQDSARVAVGDRIGLLETTPDGVSSISFPAGRATATITYHGWSQASIVEMASGIRFARSGRPRFADDGFQSDHTRLLSRSSFGIGLAADLFMTDVISSAHYEQVGGGERDGGPATIDITTRKADPQLDGILATFVISSPTLLGGNGTMFNPIGADAVLSGNLHFANASAPQDLHVLQWTVGDRTVQLTTTLMPAELTDAFPLGLVGPGTVGAWTRQQIGVGSEMSPRATVDLGSGTLDDGGMWQMNIQPVNAWVNAFLTSPDRSRGIVVQMDLGFRGCATAASAESTVIFCVRRAGVGAATLRLDTASGSVDVPLTPVGDDGEWIAVVHRFDDVGGYRASIIGANGATTPALALGDLAAS